MTLRFQDRLLDFETPKIMGILNVTPDSFYANSRVQSLSDILLRAEKMLSEGATFLDIGGYSTRPGAAEISESEEIDRVIPVIEALRPQFPEALLSIDTFRASVAEWAIKAGANLVNDISGGNLDAMMFETVARLQIPYVLMHSRGNPQTMTKLTHYQDLVIDIIDELRQKIEQLRTAGVVDIIIDPGLGFAKTADQNYEILKHLAALKVFELPLLVGVSRKSMIWRTLQIEPIQALNGTTVLNTIALLKGASILRVHDVREAIETVKLAQKIL